MQNWVIVCVPFYILKLTNPFINSIINFRSTSFGNPLELTFTYSGNILYLEHLVVRLTLNVSNFSSSINESKANEIVRNYNYPDISAFSSYIKRGDLRVTITSPMSTTSTLLFERAYDLVNTEGYYEWPLLSVLHWGENPRGTWTIRVMWTNSNGGSGIVSDVSAVLYGVSQVPQSVANIPERCSSSCARPKGCSGPDPDDCDACNSDLLRNATSLECIQKNECVAPYKIASGYYSLLSTIPSSATPTPSSATPIPSLATSFTSSIMLLFGSFFTVLVLLF